MRTECFIDGKWISSAQKSKVINPANGQVLCEIPVLGAAETKQAIAAANRALPAWQTKSANERAVILRNFSQLMSNHSNDLATILTTEQGKPLGEAKAEIGISGAYMEWFGEEAKRIYGDVIPSGPIGTRIWTVKQSVGVVGMITPWNFPSSMITRKAAAALAAGCTAVIKPSEFTPLSAFVLAEIANRAGVPPGVLNFVTGDVPAIGGELTSNPVVKKISFTGSTRVGKLLLRQSADTVKKVSMELGGNAPFIVFNDADIEKAAAGVILCKFRNAGQTCVSANRIFVQSGIYDKFTAVLTAKVKAMKIGNGLDAGVTLGPLINAAAVKKVSDQVSDAVAKGGQIVCGGSVPPAGSPLSNGTFYIPTVITNARPEMQCFSEETFGPLAPLFKVSCDTAFWLVGRLLASHRSHRIASDHSPHSICSHPHSLKPRRK